jgi:hypothetical protein
MRFAARPSLIGIDVGGGSLAAVPMSVAASSGSPSLQRLGSSPAVEQCWTDDDRLPRLLVGKENELPQGAHHLGSGAAVLAAFLQPEHRSASVWRGAWCAGLLAVADAGPGPLPDERAKLREGPVCGPVNGPLNLLAIEEIPLRGPHREPEHGHLQAVNVSESTLVNCRICSM